MTLTEHPTADDAAAGPSTRCLSALLLDALRIARERGDQLDHVRRKLAFTVDLAVGLGAELDTLRDENRRLRDERRKQVA